MRIVAEADLPGACFAEVARRHEVSRSVLWSWRKQVRSGALVAEQAPVFVPMQIVPERTAMAVPPSAGPPAALPAADPADARDDRIEILLPDGRHCGFPRRSAPRRCVACCRRCADDPCPLRCPCLAGGGPHGYAPRALSRCLASRRV
uniref:transposase n=1 Tax=uncultured Sphingomonas sp. TaxID=158754 RepID=UPI003458A45B